MNKSNVLQQLLPNNQMTPLAQLPMSPVAAQPTLGGSLPKEEFQDKPDWRVPLIGGLGTAVAAIAGGAGAGGAFANNYAKSANDVNKAMLEKEKIASQEESKYVDQMIRNKQVENAMENNNLNRQLRMDMLNDKRAAAAEKGALSAEAQTNVRSGAISGLRQLKKLADSGAIWSGNNKTGGLNLFGEGGKAVGERQAALSALAPALIDIARKGGASGINSIGEAMLYLGIPENSTSAQLQGVIPMLKTRLGISDDELNIIPAAQGQSSTAATNGKAF